MQISSVKLQKPQLQLPAQAAVKSEAKSDEPSETFSKSSESSSLAFAGLGVASGVLGVGLPAGLAMGSVKSFMSGQLLLGTGLAVGAVASGATLGVMGLMGAAMSTDSGANAGMNGYLAGAAVSTAAAGYAVFF